MNNSEFIEELSLNGIKVVVAECQDPSTFWLNDFNSFNDSERINKCTILEKELTDSLQVKLHCYENHLVEIGDLVAVKYPEINVWCRGKVCDIFQKQSKYLYKVYLLDRGFPIICNSTNLKSLPHAFKKETFVTYDVKLFNILPQNFNECSQHNDFSLSWTGEAFNLVTELIVRGNSHYFVPKVTKQVVCGDLFVKCGSKFVNIGDELCSNQLAFRNLRLFSSCLNLSLQESVSSEFCISESIYNENKSQSGQHNGAVSSEPNIAEHFEGKDTVMIDASKCRGLGRGTLLRNFLEKRRYVSKPGFDNNFLRDVSKLTVSGQEEQCSSSTGNDFTMKGSSFKISIGRGEHLRIFNQLSDENFKKSSDYRSPFHKNVHHDHKNLIDEKQLDLKFNGKAKIENTPVAFVPAGAESSVLQSIIMKKNQ